MTDPKQPSEAFDVSALYQQGATEQPPESLDQEILAQAKNELEQASGDSKDRSASSIVSRVRKWQWPLSAAAVVVISSSIILDLHQQQKLEVKLDTDLPYEVPMEETFKTEAYQAKPRQPEPSFSDSVELESDAIDIAPAPVAPASQFSAPPMLEEREMMQTESIQIEPTQIEPTQIEPTQIEPTQTESIQIESIQNDSMQQEMKEKKRTLESQRLMRQKREAVLSGKGAVSSGQSEDELTEPEWMSATDWIAKIDGLLEEGRPDQAKASLLAFRRVYPDYPLPDHLVSLLKDSED